MKQMIDSGSVDFGRQSESYAIFRPGFPDSFYRRLNLIIPIQGSNILDVATGPGVVGLELAKRGAMVWGIDISQNQILAAESRARNQRLDSICNFSVQAVESTTFEDQKFDAAIAGQCWHWFDEEAAMRELSRILKPGGCLVIANFNYLSKLCEVANRTEVLILEHNPKWAMAGNTGLYPEHIDTLVLGGFELIEQFCYDHFEPMSHEAWRGRMRTCNGVGSGVLSKAELNAFDDSLMRMLQQDFPSEPMPVRHRVWATVVRK